MFSPGWSLPLGELGDNPVIESRRILWSGVYGMARYARADQGLLAMALVGYVCEKAKIEATIGEIRARLGQRGPGRSRTAVTETAQAGPQKRIMSASARRRIAMAQKKGWAAVKKATATPAKPKRKLSAAGRKAIIEALRKRWAAVRKAKAQKSTSKPKGRKAAAKAPKNPAAQSASATA